MSSAPDLQFLKEVARAVEVVMEDATMSEQTRRWAEILSELVRDLQPD